MCHWVIPTLPCSRGDKRRSFHSIEGTMRMFVLISHFQKLFEEVNRSFALHSAWTQRQYEAGRFLVSAVRAKIAHENAEKFHKRASI